MSQKVDPTPPTPVTPPELTTEVFQQINTCEVYAKIYLLAAKSKDEKFSVAQRLATNGGCQYVVPAVDKNEITQHLVTLARKGFTHFTLILVDCNRGDERSRQGILEYQQREGKTVGEYFNRKCNGMNNCILIADRIYYGDTEKYSGSDEHS